MNATTIGQLCRPSRRLVLAARLAAGAFCRRHLKRLLPLRPALRTPVLLRWARKVAASRPDGQLRWPVGAGQRISHLHLCIQLTALLGVAGRRAQEKAGAVGSSAGALTGGSPRDLALANGQSTAGLAAGLLYRPMRATEGSTVAPAPARLAGDVLSRFNSRFEASLVAPMQSAPALRSAARAPAMRFANAAKVSTQSPLVARGDASAAGSCSYRSSYVAGSSHFGGSSDPGGSNHWKALNGTPMARSIVPLRPMAAGSALSPLFAAAVSVGQSIRTWTHIRPETGFSSLTRTPVARSFRYADRDQASPGRSEPLRQREPARPSSERARRAKSKETATTHSSTRVHDLVLRRSAELVWRADPSGPGIAGHRARYALPTGMPISSARLTSASAHALSSTGRMIDEPVVRATALDPALADRLAEDVIRKIDRRARIERERRGL